MRDVIRLRGIRVHNLKNIDLDIPVGSLTVICGPSGSGKSSLAFDTLYAEGRRRFVQSLSAYARQFLERIDRPDADQIESIFPAIAVQQKNTVTGSRSTVGTVTEIYDYLRLLFARVGLVRCPSCGKAVRTETVEDVAAAVENLPPGTQLRICFRPIDTVSPAELIKRGFVRALRGGREVRLEELDGAVDSSTAVVADRLIAGPEARARAAEAAETAFLEGAGAVELQVGEERRVFSLELRCSSCGKDFLKPEPRLFSFNNPFGACPRCRGFGDIIDVNLQAVVADPERSLTQGAIEPWRPSTREPERRGMIEFAREQGIPLDRPWSALGEEQRRLIIDGKGRYRGVRGFFKHLEEKKYKLHVRVLLSRYRGYVACPECGGSRLRGEALAVRMGKQNIGDVVAMSIRRAAEWLEGLRLSDHQRAVASRVLQELELRLALLGRIGLGYLTLDRRAQTLSGGESQRLSLGTSLAGGLVGTLFVLDEPTIGLHPRDCSRLVEVIRSIRDRGNTVIVVEHDRQTIEAADYIVDLGPGAGRKGGEVVFAGRTADFHARSDSVTAKYLRGERTIPLPPIRRRSTGGSLLIRGAREHNLKNITVEVPLGLICCVTGVSGSGKTTLVHDVLYANAMAARGKWRKRPGECDGIDGLERVPDIEMVDQSPIGRTPRSNPVTYMKAFGEIRDIFAARYPARMRGYSASHFSFNVKGGRCETCGGTGEISVEMQFLPDVTIRCEDCGGRRYKPEILDIRFKGLNIHQVLQLSVEEALEVFRDSPGICRKLSVLDEVGLGYLQLGQSAATLSGGEGQRVKLALHMSRSDVSGALFIFDEPTTGLHFSDIKKLLQCFRRLVFHGASILVIEHNLDVIKNADWVIDLGPDGGGKGGWVVASGTPEDIASRSGSVTGRYLQPVLATEGKGDMRATV